MTQDKMPHDIDRPFDQRLVDIQPTLTLLAWILTGDPHKAAKLLQETNTRALERQSQCRGDIGRWVRRIMRRLRVDSWRRRARRREVSLPTDPGHRPVRSGDIEDLADMLEADRQRHLARFLRIGLSVCGDRAAWAEAAGLKNRRCVAAELSRVRRWCHAHGISLAWFHGREVAQR